MFRSIVILAVVCALASAVPFDLYSRRYGVCKQNMPGLLTVAPGQTRCQFVTGMLSISSQVTLTVTQNATLTAWVNLVESSIINNSSISNQTDKFSMIAASLQNFSMDTSATNGSGIYGMIMYSNISTWGCPEQFMKITNEYNFQYSLTLVVPTDKTGNCKLFDSILASITDAAKKASFQAFINSDLKPMMKGNLHGKETDLIVSINKLIVGKWLAMNSSWKQWFFGLQIKGNGPMKPMSFGQFSSCGGTFEKSQTSVTVMAGSNTTCPFILALNATMGMSNYTNSQKGVIKTLITYFQAQFSTTVTFQDRLDIISKKYSEMCDSSPGNFALMNSIYISGFGGFFDMIQVSCQINIQPTTCGCVKPVLNVMTTTEMPSTTTSKCHCKCDM